MSRLFYISILLILPLQTIASTTYTVRIAVYNNAEALQHELNKLSPALRKTIQVKKRGHQHVASSVHTDKKETLQKLLPAYQKVFPDAFISTEEAPDIKTPERNVVESKEKNTTHLRKENVPVSDEHATQNKKVPPQTTPQTDYTPYSRKVVDPTNKNLSLHDRLHQKTLYLCAYGPEEWSPNVLIHVAFFDQKVIYTPIQGDISSKKEKYKVIKEKLYISHQGVFDPETYSTIEKITEDYYLISTWIGKHKTTSIRYYFDLEKAEAYVKTLR
jgi:uncharacterized protein YfkK (UPF0435 family)